MQVSTLVALITAFNIVQKTAFELRTRELFSDLEIQPTVDKTGRYHAPVDGYVWINGDTYLGGQYLPVDEDNGKGKATQTKKIKIELDAVPALKEVVEGSHGKSWEENGKQVCYFYAQVEQSLLTLINKQLPDAGSKRIVLVDIHGNPTNQKTWKWSTPRLIAKHAVYGQMPDLDFLDMLMNGLNLCVDDTRKTKAKWGHWYARDYDGNMAEGKEVRYHYPKPITVTI